VTSWRGPGPGTRAWPPGVLGAVAILTMHAQNAVYAQNGMAEGRRRSPTRC
jgi:hypothetical protein